MFYKFITWLILYPCDFIARYVRPGTKQTAKLHQIAPSAYAKVQHLFDVSFDLF